MDGTQLRTERTADHRDAERAIREAFWNVYSPGASEHFLLHNMRKSPDFIAELATVALIGGRIVGAVACMAGTIRTDRGRQVSVVTVGPIGVVPGFQRQGIGSMLMEHTAVRARAEGHCALMLCGDPAYYSRRGFVPAERFGIRTADDMYFDALQARELTPGALSEAAGTYHESEAYAVDEAALADFDTRFEPKEMVSGTPSQLRFERMMATMRPRG